MYTDPGIISMVIAAIVGGLIAIPAYLYTIRKKIGDWINEQRIKINKKRSR
jgi:hypothetical protein